MTKLKGNTMIRMCLAMCVLLFGLMLISSCTKDIGDLADAAPIITTKETNADGSFAASFTISSEKTYYDRITENIDNLPVTELSEVLSTIGAENSTEAGYFMTDLLGRFYYSIDLSSLVPVCYTPEHELVCKLNNETKIPMLIVLDSIEEPTNVRYYLSPEWILPMEQVAFLLDGQIPQEDEAILCEQLFQMHTKARGLKKCNILDGDASTHTVSVRFEQYPGLEYSFLYYQYQGYDGYILYCLSDECMEQVVLES